MKKAIKTLFALLFMTLTVSGAFSADKKNKPETKLIDNYVAIFDFEITAGEKSISRPLADKVIHEFSQSDKYEVIDRGNMNKILKEQKFQMSGCVAQECKVEAGQILGVGKIVNGSVGMVGKVYYLTLQLIDVKTGKVELSAEDECRCELEELLGSTRRLAKRLLGGKVEQSAEAAAKAYAEEIERMKAELTAKAKAEAEAAARAETAAKAKAEEMERAKAAEIARAKAAGPEPRITNSIGMTFVYIKPGTFMMGSPSGESGRDNGETQHQVTRTKGYYMGETEVTVGQWRTFARDAGYRTEAETGGGAYTWAKGKWEKKEGTYWDNPGFTQSDNHPVTCVSWNDVQEYIKWLNRKEGSNRYRLPTEAEWEYAARAGTQTARFWGEDPDQACSYANVADQTAKRKWSSWPVHNCDDRYAETSPIRSYQANGFGLYDMIGNVWEWCEDWKDDYPSGSVTDPTGPYSGSRRVFRGGGWGSYARNCRSALRDGDTPGYRRDRLGFRLSRTPLSEQVEQSVAIAPKLAVPDRPAEPKPVTTPITIVPPAAPAKETARDGRFIAYSNGTVLDTNTNLMWAAKDNGSDINWANAKSYCENYRGGGYSDWRMPTQDELAGLYDSNKSYKATQRDYSVHLTELIKLSACCPWASETRGSDAAGFYFSTGGRFWGPRSIYYTYRALPVRSGK